MNQAVPRYNRRSNQEFARQLKQRVNDYFDKQHLKRTGDWRIAFKALVMFSLYFAPYALIVSLPLNTWQYLACASLMGFGLAGIGLAIMHDANHGSLSSKAWVNKLAGYSLNLIGGNALNWRIQHNVLHHSFTNVKGLDEDLEAGNIMRFTPHEPWKKRHRYQYIYAWALYSLMTFSWVLIKDFKRLNKYHRLGLLEAQGASLGGSRAVILFSKLFYIAYMLVVPMYLGYNPWLVLGAFFLSHIIGGLLLAMIFQPAHIMESHDFMPEGLEELNDCYESHQLHTTTNFAPGNALLTWYCGGLNYQIEHHIFPSICHIHYPALSKIVQQTAEEYGIPYRSVKTFSGALAIHQRTMYKLSQEGPWVGTGNLVAA